jgi:pimeloyl-ACP methyl ester carboxylesterase
MQSLDLPGTDGVVLHVNLWPGDGIPFLLVHGLASDARLWDGVAAALAGRGHPVAAVDQRGHGLSAKPDHGYDFGTLTGDLIGVIDGLGWERPVAAGQSWGANVVLELAWRCPERLRGLACVDGGWIELSRRFASFEACWSALAPPQLAGRPLAEFEPVLRAWHPDWPETGIQGTLANFEVRPDGTIAPWLTRDRHRAILEQLWAHRPSRRYPELRVPVLLMPAERPDGTDARHRAEQRALVEGAEDGIPVVRTHRFSPADHDVHAQHPEEVAAVLGGAVADGYFS